MNTFVSRRPRPMCRLVQGWVSVFGDGTRVPQRGFSSRHVATCDCCRQFFSDAVTLESSLRREAGRENEMAAPELDRRIIEAIHRSARPPAKRRSPIAAISLVGVAAAAALAVFIFQESPAPVGMSPMAVVDPVATVNPTGALAPDGLLNRLPPEAGAILGGEPLQHEADAVYSDARSAIGFLALNFLPSVPDSLATGVEKTAPRASAIGG